MWNCPFSGYVSRVCLSHVEANIPWKEQLEIFGVFKQVFPQKIGKLTTISKILLLETSNILKSLQKNDVPKIRPTIQNASLQTSNIGKSLENKFPKNRPRNRNESLELSTISSSTSLEPSNIFKFLERFPCPANQTRHPNKSLFSNDEFVQVLEKKKLKIRARNTKSLLTSVEYLQFLNKFVWCPRNQTRDPKYLPNFQLPQHFDVTKIRSAIQTLF